MKNLLVKIGALLLVLVLGATVCVSCGKEDAEKEPSKPIVTGTKFDPANIPELPEGVGQSEIDKFYEEQYANMTPEDIKRFEQDLIDLGITKEQFYSLMYAGGNGATTTTAATTAATAAETTEAK